MYVCMCCFALCQSQCTQPLTNLRTYTMHDVLIEGAPISVLSWTSILTPFDFIYALCTISVSLSVSHFYVSLNDADRSGAVPHCTAPHPHPPRLQLRLQLQSQLQSQPDRCTYQSMLIAVWPCTVQHMSHYSAIAISIAIARASVRS